MKIERLELQLRGQSFGWNADEMQILSKNMKKCHIKPSRRFPTVIVFLPYMVFSISRKEKMSWRRVSAHRAVDLFHCGLEEFQSTTGDTGSGNFIEACCRAHLGSATSPYHCSGAIVAARFLCLHYMERSAVF